MNLTILDIIIFTGYFTGVILFAIIVAARSKTKSASDYFLASKKLPWYAVGASFIASNVSTEHFIGMVGWGFLYGMAVANWEWGNVFTFSALIWIFLPFYMRGNVSTMPEFLEKRFNKSCRYIYAVVMIVGLVIAMLGGVMFAGAKAINVFFPQVSVTMGIIILAVAAGSYTIYGGLLSVVWADFLQYILLMAGGIVVTIFGLHYAGGISNLMASMPEKFIVFYSPQHEMIPWTGWVAGIFSVGIWYNCANQFMVQRCLGARSEWDARMGIVMAGFSKAFLPFIVVVPGIIAFYLFQSNISDGDQAWPFMVNQFLPAGFIGLVLAGLASAILSTLSAITNSSSTIFTLDIYKPIFRKKAGDKELHFVGRLSGVIVMVVGIVIALILASFPGITVFKLIQTVFFYIASPISACFLIGIMWKKITPAAATVTMIFGFIIVLPLTIFVNFPMIPLLQPYNSFMYHTFFVFCVSILILVILSFFTKPKAESELVGVIWTKSALRIPEDERKKYKGFRNLGIWWALMVITIVSLCVYTAMHGSKTLWLEAEKVNFTVTKNSTVEVQKRSALASKEKFNLWTGSGQVLFIPSKSGESLTFKVPVKEEGEYKLSALITLGKDYGNFHVLVDNQKADISYPLTILSETKPKFSVTNKTVAVFKPNDLIKEINENSGDSSIAGPHTVKRINFGTFSLKTNFTDLVFVAEDVLSSNSLIGVDQIMLTKNTKGKK